MNVNLLPGEIIKLDTSEYILSNYRLIQDRNYILSRTTKILMVKDIKSVVFTNVGKTAYLKFGILTGLVSIICFNYPGLPNVARSIGFFIGIFAFFSFIIYMLTRKKNIRCSTATNFIDIPVNGLKKYKLESLFELIDSARISPDLVGV